MPPYKSRGNHWYTKALFRESSLDYTPERRPIDPVFSLVGDYPGLINARRTFVELGDPSGYKWAMKYLGDWEHWNVLMDCTWFKAAYKEWMRELNAKLHAEAMDRIREIAQDPSDKQALTAAKWLASQPWEKDKQSRGRPTKEEVQGELKRQVQAVTQEDLDAERIGLKRVK